MAQLAAEAEYRLAGAIEQIAVDVPRCDAEPDDQKALGRILSVWTLLNRGIGYYQGLNLLASALYSVFWASSSHPEHDTLALLAPRGLVPHRRLVLGRRRLRVARRGLSIRVVVVLLRDRAISHTLPIREARVPTPHELSLIHI